MRATESQTASTVEIDLFMERATALGVEVCRVATSPDAAGTIIDFAKDAGADQTLMTSDLRESAPALVAALDESGFAWTHSGEPAATNDHPFGVSLAHLAIAETASVLLTEASLEDRGIGLLVASQLVVCPTSALVSSLTAAAAALRAIASQPGGGYSTLVTGPSRTADIERVLTVGVQGPARVVVLFVDDLR